MAETNPQQQITFPLDPASVQILVQALTPYFGAALVAQIVAGVGITVNPSTGLGAVTVTNAGVLSLLNGAGVSLSGSTGNITITVSDATLSTSDITTNNVSISKHGFVPKLPNDATKFLNGVGTFSTPSGGGGSATYANGQGQYITGTTTSPITIAHGLGVTPQRVALDVNFASATILYNSHGVFNGGSQNSISSYYVGGSGGGAQYSQWSFIAVIFDLAFNELRFTCSVDATNITLTVTTAGGTVSPGETYDYVWEANT